jgi:hypothetical protein
MNPLHRQLFEETKAANAAGFAEQRRLIAEVDRLAANCQEIVDSWKS